MDFHHCRMLKKSKARGKSDCSVNKMNLKSSVCLLIVEWLSEWNLSFGFRFDFSVWKHHTKLLHSTDFFYRALWCCKMFKRTFEKYMKTWFVSLDFFLKICENFSVTTFKFPISFTFPIVQFDIQVLIRSSDKIIFRFAFECKLHRSMNESVSKCNLTKLLLNRSFKVIQRNNIIGNDDIIVLLCIKRFFYFSNEKSFHRSPSTETSRLNISVLLCLLYFLHD